MLDTGALHVQTLALKDTLEQHYQREVKVYRPDAAHLAQFVAQNGTKAMYQSVALRKACCQVRKLEPLQQMLAGQAGWITGLRQEQSDARAHVDAVQDDTQPHAQPRVKISPLKDWNLGDVWHYVQLHGVPYNPLHDAFYPSIGCEPCTRAITPGETFAPDAGGGNLRVAKSAACMHMQRRPCPMWWPFRISFKKTTCLIIE